MLIRISTSRGPFLRTRLQLLSHFEVTGLFLEVLDYCLPERKKPSVSGIMLRCIVSFNIYAWLIVRDYFLFIVCSMYSVYCYLMCDHIAAVISYAIVMLTDMLIYLCFHRNH